MGSNIYGLSNEVNSHMAKNTKWSAVLYLSHSKYGMNGEISAHSGYIIGCGDSVDDSLDDLDGLDGGSGDCEVTYGSTTTYSQSTTGNITGVFDMSGGANEYVMGVFANSDGILWSGNTTTYNSGFNGLVDSSGTSYASGIAFPELKYYNVYKAGGDTTTVNLLTACNGGYCYGHGLSEVFGWYRGWNDTVSDLCP